MTPFEEWQTRRGSARFDAEAAQVEGRIGATHLGEADVALEWAAAEVFAQVEVGAERIAWKPDGTPRALGLRVLERIVARFGASQPRGAEVARWFDALAAGQIATLAGVRGDGRKSVWCFTRAAPRRHGAVRPTPSPGA